VSRHYRLSVIQIDVPPPRDRLDDVPLLAEFLLARFRSQAAHRIAGFAPAALAAMTRHAWPGNVRELRNAVERAVVLGDRDQIIAAAAPPRTRPLPPTPPLGSNSSATIDPLPPPPPPPVSASPPLPAAPPGSAVDSWNGLHHQFLICRRFMEPSAPSVF
jgi:DNA-binding NtrC family response regulator